MSRLRWAAEQVEVRFRLPRAVWGAMIAIGFLQIVEGLVGLLRWLV